MPAADNHNTVWMSARVPASEGLTTPPGGDTGTRGDGGPTELFNLAVVDVPSKRRFTGAHMCYDDHEYSADDPSPDSVDEQEDCSNSNVNQKSPVNRATTAQMYTNCNT